MLDREGPIPVYKQVAEIIRRRIDHGELKAGDAVPSEVELEAEYGIARMTARRVARELRELGLVHTIQGEGTFVGDDTAPRNHRRPLLYQQIAEEIAERIRREELSPNRPIPSEKALMRQHSVAKATVRQAVALLRERKWVFTVPYRGTYVSPREDWPQD
ncbi:GntR family transcriptional regulator [Microtetraspora malaysiensis]|uniref:GntR family transcriptional regulator n=1 Tax=Microtetraspora malaysiensis TaxID=161358 RepID=UPI000835708B|nr:GntR family transcriptional regulator [Microtetraspora malaysiensis]